MSIRLPFVFPFRSAKGVVSLLHEQSAGVRFFAFGSGGIFSEVSEHI